MVVVAVCSVSVLSFPLLLLTLGGRVGLLGTGEDKGSVSTGAGSIVWLDSEVPSMDDQADCAVNAIDAAPSKRDTFPC